jgi:hypothetical protein
MHAHFNNLYFNECYGGTRACAFQLQDYGCLFDSHYGPLVLHSLKRVSGCSSEIKVSLSALRVVPKEMYI